MTVFRIGPSYCRILRFQLAKSMESDDLKQRLRELIATSSSEEGGWMEREILRLNPRATTQTAAAMNWPPTRACQAQPAQKHEMPPLEK